MTESVEVVFATPEHQVVVTVDWTQGMTVAAAVEDSHIQRSFQDHDLTRLPKGVWGTKQADNHPVQPGDRIEIYRPLTLDPREARRRRASKQKAEKSR